MLGADDSKADNLKAADHLGAAYTVKNPFRCKELLEAVAACVPIKPD